MTEPGLPLDRTVMGGALRATTSRGLLSRDRRAGTAIDDMRAAALGIIVGAAIVISMITGSGPLMLAASAGAIGISIVSPLAGMIALAFVAPLARPLVIPAPGIYVAVIAAMLFGVILRLPIDRPRLRLPSAEVLLLGAFLAYVAVHFAGFQLDGYSGTRAEEIARSFARLMEAGLTFGAAYIVLRDRSPYPILAATLLAALAASTLALSQVVGATSIFDNLIEPPGDSGRISGVIADPNMFGSYLAAMITLAVACAVIARSVRLRLTLLAVAAYVGVALLFTQSRGALLALMAGVVTVAFSRGRRSGFIVLASVLLVAAVAYPIFAQWRFGDELERASIGLGPGTDASGRVGAWAAGGQLFLSSPWFGVGFDRSIEESAVGIGAHNWYVKVAAELGLVGVALWALFIVAIAIALWSRPPPARSVGFSVLAVWLVASMTLLPPASYKMTGPVLIVVATASVASWIARSSGPSASRSAPRSRYRRPRAGTTLAELPPGSARPR